MCLSVSSKPPLAVFFATIVGFVLALVFVCFYLQSHRAEILNPDIKDWNSFYSTLSDMDICFSNSSVSSKRLRTLREVAPTVMPNNTEEANVTFNIYADVQVEWDGKNLEGLVFHAFIDAKFLGFKRDAGALEVTIELAKNVAKNWTACMTLSGPAHLLPDSPQLPPKCVASQNTKPVDVLLAQPWMVDNWCKEGKIGSLTVAPQHELNVYLSEGDVTLIQVHILYTTCLLCVMMMALLFYFIFGKRFCTRTKTVQMPDKIPLHP